MVKFIFRLECYEAIDLADFSSSWRCYMPSSPIKVCCSAWFLFITSLAVSYCVIFLGFAVSILQIRLKRAFSPMEAITKKAPKRFCLICCDLMYLAHRKLFSELPLLSCRTCTTQDPAAFAFECTRLLRFYTFTTWKYHHVFGGARSVVHSPAPTALHRFSRRFPRSAVLVTPKQLEHVLCWKLFTLSIGKGGEFPLVLYVRGAEKALNDQ